MVIFDPTLCASTILADKADEIGAVLVQPDWDRYFNDVIDSFYPFQGRFI